MNDRGLLADFLVCKVGVALAAFAFIGVVLSMHASFGHLSEREKMAQLTDVITDTIGAVDFMPGETELRRQLPLVSTESEVVVTGRRNGDFQVVCVHVFGDAKVERVLMLTNRVNGGEFKLSVDNPREIHLKKSGMIQLELI
ncbi:MAG: hypothetical protein DRN83_04005 [Hadesarchaea archaeon]|nr:MAG: hypothetical protein DRN83_04005 [Hadesarchaea archaeon]